MSASVGVDAASRRRNQINTLRIFNEGVSEVRPDFHYRVDFETSSGLALSLHIQLPQGFPRERPHIRLAMPQGMHHPWIDPQTGVVVAAPGLLNYSVHSDLGRVVQAIKRELEKNPPQAMTAPMSSASSLRAMPGVTKGAYPQTPSTATAAAVHPMPKPATTIPGLLDLSLDELHHLDGSDRAVRVFARRLEQETRLRLESDVTNQRKCVRHVAENNLQLETALTEARTALLDALHAHAAMQVHVGEVAGEVAQLAQSHATVKAVCDKMRASSQEAESESDSIAEQFVNGDIGIEAFLKDYQASRIQYHTRRAKLDKARALKGDKDV